MDEQRWGSILGCSASTCLSSGLEAFLHLRTCCFEGSAQGGTQDTVCGRGLWAGFPGLLLLTLGGSALSPAPPPLRPALFLSIAGSPLISLHPHISDPFQYLKILCSGAFCPVVASVPGTGLFA